MAHTKIISRNKKNFVVKRRKPSHKTMEGNVHTV
jgi:hypothetical protein